MSDFKLFKALELAYKHQIPDELNKAIRDADDIYATYNNLMYNVLYSIPLPKEILLHARTRFYRLLGIDLYCNELESLATYLHSVVGGTDGKFIDDVPVVDWSRLESPDEKLTALIQKEMEMASMAPEVIMDLDLVYKVKIILAGFRNCSDYAYSVLGIDKKLLGDMANPKYLQFVSEIFLMIQHTTLSKEFCDITIGRILRDTDGVYTITEIASNCLDEEDYLEDLQKEFSKDANLQSDVILAYCNRRPTILRRAWPDIHSLVETFRIILKVYLDCQRLPDELHLLVREHFYQLLKEELKAGDFIQELNYVNSIVKDSPMELYLFNVIQSDLTFPELRYLILEEVRAASYWKTRLLDPNIENKIQLILASQGLRNEAGEKRLGLIPDNGTPEFAKWVVGLIETTAMDEKLARAALTKVLVGSQLMVEDNYHYGMTVSEMLRQVKNIYEK